MNSPTLHPPSRTPPGFGAAFATTHWSVVTAAGGSDTTHARDALASLCQSYWYPLYAFVRRRGHSPPDAQDLTQAFFARLLERQWLQRADRDKGRFRSFLLSALTCFLADEWDKLRARKRGGGLPLISLDVECAETRYRREPAETRTPENIYERQWALTLLEEVLSRVRAEYETEGRADLFEALHPCLVGERTAQPYAELARRLGVTEGTVKATVHRLRHRYRQLLRQAIAHTVNDPAEVDDELRHLFTVLSEG